MANNTEINVVVTGTSSLEKVIAKHAAHRFPFYIEKMPEGKFWNCHGCFDVVSGYPDHADAIALTLDGRIVSLKKRMHSLNPLFIFKDGEAKEKDGVTYRVGLSTSSCGGNFHWLGSWERSVEKFNEETWDGHDAIVAYYVFNA